MCGERGLMDTVIDCLMDSWGALWLWVFATVQDIFILQLTQSWLLAWIIAFSACKYHSLNKYFIRNKPVAGREEKADAQCCVFRRRYRVYRTDTEIIHEMCSGQTRGLQNLVFRTTQEAGRSLKVNLNPSREAQYGPRRMYCSGEVAVLKLASSEIPPFSLPSSRLSFHITTRRGPDQEKEY